MSAIWMRAKNDLRARWRGALLLSLVIGATAALAMTAAAGARRTATSYERLLETSKAFDLEVQLTGDSGSSNEAFDSGLELLDAIAALPQVADHAKIAFVPATRGEPGAEPAPFSWDISTITAVDRSFGTTLEIPRVVSGRRPDLNAPHEAMVSPEFLDTWDISVGDEFPLQLVTFDEVLELFGGRSPTPTGPMPILKIVGAWRGPHDVAIQEETGLLFLTPAFYERYSADIATLESLVVRLKDRAGDTEAFVAGARSIAGVDAISIVPQEDLVTRVDGALGVQSTALWALAIAVAAGGALVLGQALGRWLTLGADDIATLRALGMGRGHLMSTIVLPGLVIGGASAGIGCAMAFLLSPLVPFGVARTIEPDLGFFWDPRVLLLGAAGVLAVVAMRAGLQGFAETRKGRGEGAERARPTAVPARLARGGAPPAMVTGVRFALEPGRGRTAVPVRSVLGGTILSIVVVVGAFVFGRSMEYMLSTPATFGWNWDLVVIGGEDPEFTAEVQRKLSASSHVSAFARASVRATTFRGADLETLAIAPVKGTVTPRILEGRFPRAPDEVALATQTLRTAGLKVGDQTSFPGADCDACSVMFRVVGRLVFWAEDSNPEVGAGFTEEGQARIATSEGFTDFLVRAPAAQDPAAADRAIRDAIGTDVEPPRLPVSIKNVALARSMPTLLAVILAVLALITMFHALITATRRRRHDLAVLKTLGFVRRQVRAAVAWQSMTTVVLSLIVGVPLGVATGRWTWTLLSDRLGVDAPPLAPAMMIALGAVGVIALANLVAMAPARAAARTQPAVVLRSE